MKDVNDRWANDGRANKRWAIKAFGGAVGLLACSMGGWVGSALAAEPAEPAHCQPQTGLQNAPIDQGLTQEIPQELTALVSQLMLDLPSYGNRVIQRASRMGDATQLYLITAGQAEIALVSLEALAAAPSQSRLPEPVPDLRSSERSMREAADEELYQVFFTTLERQYLRPELRSPLPSSPGASQPAPEQAISQALDRVAPSNQQFHWLILARQQDTELSGNFSNRPTASPWRIISLRSKLAPYPAAGQLLSPARNSRQGPIGQAIGLWLRDWHSGVIRPVSNDIGNHSDCVSDEEPKTVFCPML